MHMLHSCLQGDYVLRTPIPGKLWAGQTATPPPQLFPLSLAFSPGLAALEEQIVFY